MGSPTDPDLDRLRKKAEQAGVILDINEGGGIKMVMMYDQERTFLGHAVVKQGDDALLITMISPALDLLSRRRG